MEIHPILLPRQIVRSALAISEFSTSCVETHSGKEIRSSDRPIVRKKYFINDCKISFAELEKFNDFFLARAGMRYGFYLYDPLDGKVNSQRIAVGDGVTKVFKLYKLYDDNIAPYRRVINRLANGTLNLKINNQASTEYTFDFEASLLTLQNALPKGQLLVASFEFLIPVRFNSDSYKYKLCDDGTVMLYDIEIKEIL